jgi:16S rRNA (adenine1518-N6/adenine1519-N6)-dimethyltransferase
MSRRKALGQHFLTDRSAIERIVGALDIREGDRLLEIGPGKGALTGPLIAAAGRIAAVEIDRALAAQLRKRFPPDRLSLSCEDFLQFDLRATATERDPLLLAGNLPFSVSNPIAQKIVRDRAWVERAVLMFQREVADRLIAAPGSRKYGPLTVLAGLAFEIRPLFVLGPRAFHPRPEVDSQVTLWTRRHDDRLTPELERRLRPCLAVCFASRRRTLRNNLRAAVRDADATERLLEAAEIDGGLRAEQLSSEMFLRLAELWGSQAAGSSAPRL